MWRRDGGEEPPLGISSGATPSILPASTVLRRASPWLKREHPVRQDDSRANRMVLSVRLRIISFPFHSTGLGQHFRKQPWPMTIPRPFRTSPGRHPAHDRRGPCRSFCRMFRSPSTGLSKRRIACQDRCAERHFFRVKLRSFRIPDHVGVFARILLNRSITCG